MEIRIRETGQILNEREFRELHRETSFPAVLSLEILNTYGVDPILEAPTPTIDSTLEVVRDGAELVNGNWVKKWITVPIAAEVYSAKLLDTKTRKNEQINKWREEANFTSFPHVGKQISCDKLSRSDIDGVANHISLFGTFPVGFPGEWKAIDNTYISMPDIQSFKDMYASMTAQGAINFSHAQQLKTTLTSVETDTIEKVNAIVW